jgi:hypothetical protein
MRRPCQRQQRENPRDQFHFTPNHSQPSSISQRHSKATARSLRHSSACSLCICLCAGAPQPPRGAPVRNKVWWQARAASALSVSAPRPTALAGGRAERRGPRGARGPRGPRGPRARPPRPRPYPMQARGAPRRAPASPACSARC